MALLIQKPREAEKVAEVLWGLLVSTKLSFAIVGICGAALLANSLGAGPWVILISALVGFLASVIATEEVRS